MTMGVDQIGGHQSRLILEQRREVSVVDEAVVSPRTRARSPSSGVGLTVRRYDECDLQVEQKVHQLATDAARIQVAGGFVQEQDRGLQGEQRREADLLLFPPLSAKGARSR